LHHILLKALIDIQFIPKLKLLLNDTPSLSREELLAFMKLYYPTLSDVSFREKIHHLKSKGILSAIDNNNFTQNIKPSFTPIIDSRVNTIKILISKHFTHLKYCIWSTKWLNEFMLHQPSKHITILEVEKEALESIFHLLQSHKIRHLFLSPTKSQIENYIFESSDAVVIKKLTTKSPIKSIKKTPTPKIEKILVDVFSDPILFSMFQGAELNFIFSTVNTKHLLNMTTLLNYAKRKGVEKSIINYINSNTKIITHTSNDK
jgi:hypothetical protein